MLKLEKMDYSWGAPMGRPNVLPTKKCKKCGTMVEQDGNPVGTWFSCPTCYRTFGCSYVVGKRPI